MYMGNYIYKVDAVETKNFLRKASEEDIKREKKVISKNDAIGFAGVLEKECSKVIG